MATLSSKKRNTLSSSTFALPKQRKFPVTDRSHAVNALARASQSGSSEIKAKVENLVHKKFPSLRKAGGKVDGKKPRHRLDRGRH